MQSWVDGRPSDALSSLKDRGLAYGDGLFETIAVKAGKPLLLELHLQRLMGGCARLAIAADQSLIRSELLAYAQAMGEGVLKLILTRGDSLRGYSVTPEAQPRRILQASPMAAYPSAYAQQGVELFDCATRLAEQPLLAGLKHLNRLEQVLARSEWQDPVYAEGLMRDTSGRIIEGVFSNLFLVQNGQLITADLHRCGVAGVISDISRQQLQQADEVFLCNSVYGIWPVRGFAELSWPVGPLTRKLQGIARTLLDV